MSTTAQLTLSTIEPDQMYSLREFCSLYPARRGGRLSIHVARRWAKTGRLPFRNIAPGGTYAQWAIRGSDILAVLGQPATPIETPAQRLQRLRGTMQELANGGGRPVYQQRLGEWFYPPGYDGPRPPKPRTRKGQP